MVDIKRKAEAVWTGDLRNGQGRLNSTSGVLQDTPYSFGTRFRDVPGTNPEELIAAAHAGCYSMALADTLGSRGYKPARIHTRATISLSRKEEGGWKVARSHLEVRAAVPGIDEATFRQIAADAEKGCPVSNALRAIAIELDAGLEGAGD
jgi:osmotically inducible protein OsmC